MQSPPSGLRAPWSCKALPTTVVSRPPYGQHSPWGPRRLYLRPDVSACPSPSPKSRPVVVLPTNLPRAVHVLHADDGHPLVPQQPLLPLTAPTCGVMGYKALLPRPRQPQSLPASHATPGAGHCSVLSPLPSAPCLSCQGLVWFASFLGAQAMLVGPAGSQGLGPCGEEEALSIYLEDTQQLFQGLASILRVLM